MTVSVSISAVSGIPDVKIGDDLAGIIGDCLESWSGGVEDGDILCIAHKIFSKAEGNIIDLSKLTPSKKARELAATLNKDPRKVEVILAQSRRIVRAFKRPEQREGTLICEHKLGFISANAAVDQSNTELADSVVTLPDNPDQSAQRLREALEKRFGCRIGVVMTDTFGRPWRMGQVNVAIGLSSVPATRSEKGCLDAWGRPLYVTEPAFADELAAASGLVVAKTAKTPLTVFRGLDWEDCHTTSIADILRKTEEDMFK